MPDTTIGAAGQALKTTGIWVGTAAGRREVLKAWAGDAAGVPRLVYSRIPSLATTLTATAASSSQINLSWTATPGCTYRLEGTSGINVDKGSALSHSNTGLAANTFYAYRVDVLYQGVKIGESHANTTTQAVPPPAFVQRTTGILAPASSGSYNGGGGRRTDTSNFYSGYYSGNQGQQQSAFCFPIPAAVRGCASVDKVEVSVKNLHSYSGAGVTQHLAVTHTQTAGPSWPGATGPFAGRATAKGGWYGGAEWVDITGDKDPTFGATVAENFHTRGAWGVCLVAPGTSQSHYSYWGGMRLRITYTVRI